MKDNKFWRPGPATLIAAAFIGPGTVTICTIAGVRHGLTLLWALLFSTFTTFILQEMSARLGVVTKTGLGESIRKIIQHPVGRVITILLVVSAIFIGNAAYEAGNISGAILGLDSLFPMINQKVWSISIGIIAMALLFVGNYRILEKTLISLVLLMSFCFILTAIFICPPWQELVQGLFSPSFAADQLYLVIGIIGTTVVPYNLFLHASLVNKKWENPSISEVRKDTFFAIIIGGLVSMSIVVCGSAVMNHDINNAADMAIALEPSLGSIAGYLLPIGLFAAGITSAVTAPLAAAFATSGILGWKNDEKSWRFRSIWASIIMLGVIFSSFGIKPIEIIQFAQVANGLLLPIIAIYLLWSVNNQKIMQQHVNTGKQNFGGVLVIIITLIISYRLLALIFLA